MLDTFESLLYFLTTVLLSHYWREGAPDAENNRRLLRKLYKGALSIGDLMEMMRETARLYLSRSDALPYPQLVGTLFKPNGDVTSTLRVLEEFVAIRNEKLAHGAGRDDRFYASIIDENRDLLDGTLARFEWLAARALYLPKKVSDEGRVTLADVFEGDFRSKSRPIDLQLSPSDLHSNGGDVVADKTLLLVDEASEHYLPLFPLALFHFQTKGQDIYPAGKFVFYRPADRPVTGGIPLARREGDIKEAMLQDWLGAVIANNVKINEEEPCVAVKNENGYFEVVTERGPKRDRTTYKARKVIIAIGNRGEPMKLRVPGEELRMFVQPEPERARCCPKCGAAKTGEYFDCARCGEKLPVRTLPAYEDSKVKYKLTDPETYSNKKCMVVAAGNSGVEAAVALAGLERRGDQITFARNNDVTIVVRSDFKNDITLRNKMDLYDCMDAGRIEVYYQSTIKEIKENEVILEDPRTRQEKARIMNDYVFAFLGSEKSIRFLENLGIRWAY